MPDRDTYYFSAGEPSGDMHAARVVREMRARGVERITGTGGDRMRAAGADLVEDITKMSAIGFLEMLGSIPRHARQLTATRAFFASGACAATVLVDYPGYNLRLAAAAAASRVPVLYYIAPQLWAWAPGRIRTMRRFVSHVAAILPFEAEFFSRRGVPTTFVGHPLLDRPPSPSRLEARGELGLGSKDMVVGMFPGLRVSERTRLTPLFLETARLVTRAMPRVRVALAGQAVTHDHGALMDGLVFGSSQAVMAAADVALCKSGTTTLEAAVAGTPLCIAYQVHPVTFRVARRLMTCPHIGLVNLLLERRAVPEFVQDDATPEQLSRTLLSLLDRDGKAVRDQLSSLREVSGLLGSPGASRRVSDLAMELAA